METEEKQPRSVAYRMRTLHRDIGYLMFGLTLVYALSGVILVYRDTDFLKSPVHVERTLQQQMAPEDIARTLHARRFEVTRTEGDVIHFRDRIRLEDGSYNKLTGTTRYVEKQFPSTVDHLISMHKLGSSKVLHVVSVLYGMALLFLAVSSFWMFRVHTRQFNHGIMVSSAGVVMAIALIVLL